MIKKIKKSLKKKSKNKKTPLDLARSAENFGIFGKNN